MKDLSYYFTRLKFKVSTRELVDLQRFCIDVFCFEFNPPLTDGLDYQLYELCEDLDLTNRKSTAVIMIWLMKKNAKFKLKFEWNEKLPVSYNWRNRHAPKKLFKLADKLTEEQLAKFDIYTYIREEAPELWHGTLN